MDLTSFTCLIDNHVDLDRRQIYLFGDINDDIVHKIIKAIHLLNSMASDPIFLWVKSPGGDVDSMFALYDCIVNSRSPISTVGTGEVCSAALLILACGHSRAATENCWGMHHQMSFTAEGTERSIDTEVSAARLQAILRYKLLAAHSKKKATWWEQKAKDIGDVWMNAEQLLEIGVVDSIHKNPKVATPKATRAKRVPKKKVILPPKEVTDAN